MKVFSFLEYHKGKSISRASGWPRCAKKHSSDCLRAETAELVPLEQWQEVSPLLV